MKCGNSPRFWVLFFLNIANNRDYAYKYCNRPVKKYDRYCLEWYIYHHPDADDI